MAGEVQTFKVPIVLKSDVSGITWLASFAGSSSILAYQRVFLDFEGNKFIEGNLCAILGSIIVGLKSRRNEVMHINMPPETNRLLKGNGFLVPRADENILINPTCVPFKKFAEGEDDEFYSYMETELFEKKAMPVVSDLARRAIIRSISEIYINGLTHGACDHVFCCGQFFPRQDLLNITIADLGRTIKANVVEYLGENMTGVDSIIWATMDTNSTKTQNHSGGLGLKITKDFIELNKGSLQIISAEGFWQLDKGTIFKDTLSVAFPGTIVTFTFNLADQSVYVLTEEVSSTIDLF